MPEKDFESGTFVGWDKVQPPIRERAHQPVVTTAHVIKRIAHTGSQIPAATPYITAMQPPQVRRPGSGGYSLPEKVLASPTIKEMQLPEQIQLSAPISRDTNPFGFLIYTKTQGLTHDFVSCFYQDPEGELWIGTMGGGLMHFNGTSIESYNKNQGFNINDVIEVVGDEKGNIWISTLEGLFKLDGHQIFRYDVQSGNLQSNALHSLKRDSNGNIWFSYRYGGVSMFDGTYFYHYGPEQGLPEAQRHILRTSDNGDVWIALYDKGLALFREGAFHLIHTPHVGPQNPISTLTVQDDNTLWLGVDHLGAMRFDGRQFYFYDSRNGFPFGRINRILVDSRQRIWFGTWGGGLVLAEDDTYTIFRTEQGLSNDFISYVFEDNRGVIWIGFHNGGMTRYRGEVFQHYSITQGVDHNIISLAATPDGKLWMSTFEDGFVSFDGKEFAQYSNRPHDPVRYMEGLFADAKGHLWMSLDDGGVTRFDGQKFYNYPMDHKEGRWFLHDGVTDRNGNTWMAFGEQGLVQFDGEFFSFWGEEQGLPSMFSSDIIMDRHGAIWVGTWGSGVYKMDSLGIRHYTSADGLAGNYIYSSFEDSLGNLWFGTEGNGVSMFNGSQFLNFSSRHGLSDNYILAIAQDHAGNVILGGRFGINVLPHQTLLRFSSGATLASKDPSREATLFVSHGFEDGFLGMGTNQEALLRQGEKMWVGTNDRLTSFFPGRSWYDSLAPRVRLTQVDLFNEPLTRASFRERPDADAPSNQQGVDGRIRFDGLSPWHQVPKNLKLSHSNNYLSFRFAGVSPDNRKLLYSFMLEGADQYWHRPTSNHVAHYGNLSPGSYTFRVRAHNALGQGGPITEYSFVILSPWWQTWWAWMGYVMLSALLLTAFVRLRIRSLLLKNQILDNQVELARKSAEIKQNIIANVSHELRTPLTGIIGLTDLLGDTPLTRTQQEYIATLRQTSRNLREIINQILDYSKIESGQVSLMRVTFSLEELFRHAEDIFESLRNEKDLKLVTRIEPEAAGMILADRGRISQVLHNLYYNAVKFTPSGTITLHASVDHRQQIHENERTFEELLLRIEVMDTGIGIPPEAMDKLFVPFSQIEVKDTRHSDSTGLGLAISRKLAEMMGGEVGVESTPGQGSRFWFTFKALYGYQGPEDSGPEEQPEDPGPLKILLVEDKKVNQLVIKLILEKMGLQVTLAEHGQKALEVYKPGIFDLVFMDIQMPVMDGITATRALRTRYTDLPPIIGLSANAFEGDREKYLSQGMDEYVTKPVSAESLKRVIARVWEKFWREE
ncbi:MAG: two-component regulator propeller domain-containing protein [Bacteroidales bacterium]